MSMECLKNIYFLYKNAFSSYILSRNALFKIAYFIGTRPPSEKYGRVDDNIKTNLRELGYAYVDCILLIQCRDQWQAVVKMVMKFRFCMWRGIL
jgi:hypothetical protein